MIEFFVDECRKDDDATIITGVVNVGVVKIGTVFNTASDESAEKTSSKPGSPIELSVTRIAAYGHYLDELPKGMTGALVIEGDGVEDLRQGRFVSSR